MARQRQLDQPKLPLNIPRAYAPLVADARYRVCYGGRGSAKSWTIARLLIARAFTQRRRILCAREFQASIADSVHKLLAEQIVALGLSRFFDVQSTRIVCLTSGSEFLFRGLRRSIQSVRSLEGIDDCWVEEAQAVTEDSWNILIPTIRKPGSTFWISFNPFEEQDATYQRFVERPPPGAVVLKTSYRDNPRLSDVLEAERRYMLRVDPDAYDWVWEGNVRHISDAVIFKGKFRIDRFDPPEGVHFRLGADWGFAADPTVLMRSYIVGRRLFIDHEAYGLGVDLDKVPILFDQVPGARQWPILADDSRPETINHIKGKGFAIKGAKKWKGSVEDGIEHLRAYEEIVIHERCEHMGQEARLYSYKTDDNSKLVLPQIVDKHNHCWDAVRYSLDGEIKSKGTAGAFARIGAELAA